MKNNLLLKNAAILTVTSLILRSIGLVFRIWMSNTVGAEGIGLYQLVVSVYVFASSFATTGICTAVTRLFSELGAKGYTSKKILSRAITFTLLISFITIAFLLTFADFIAINLVEDARATSSIKILGLGIPFMGLCSVYRGYFIARRKTAAQSIGQIVEQIVRISVIVTFVSLYVGSGLEKTVAAILLGDSIAEVAGCAYLYISYRLESKKTGLEEVKSVPVTHKLVHIALPITAGKYIHTALRTFENLLVPSTLAKYTLNKTRALEEFGMIKGMAIPLLFFPASFLTAFSTLLIPEMSEALTLGRMGKVRSGVERSIGITVIISTLIAGVFFLCSDEISTLLYPDSNISPLLKSLAPLVPFMYLECVCDGILKGLDQQKHSFLYGVIDSITRIALIYLFLPSHGMTGFLWIMVYSNLLTSLLNIRRLLKFTRTPLKIGSWAIKPFLAITIGIGLGLLSMSSFSSPLLRLVTGGLVTAISYLLIMFFMGELKIAYGILE